MIKRTFDLKRRYRFATYGRMSDKKQNERSPDQQFNEIDRLIARLECPWTHVASYRDDGIKARYFRARDGLQALLRDVETGTIDIDLILVDTWERFGRQSEFEALRSKLLNDHGVMILTVDSGFADPTGVVGKALGLVENIRSTEDGRIKAHNVLRGKRDALLRKRWPGGPPPFGFRLKRLVEGEGREPELYSVLEHDPSTIWVRRELLHKAKETGWGGNRLAAWLNEREDIATGLKPFNAPSVAMWLTDPINVGTYVWGEHNTDIVNDARVIEKNPNADEILRIEGFCEPVVGSDVFEAVVALAEARSAAARASRAATGEEGGADKLVKPIARGIPLQHALSGLVVCECNAAMTAVGSGRRSKAGRSYTYRTCPRSRDHACGNRHHVREDALFAAVMDRIRAQLLPADPQEVPRWFPQVLSLIEEELHSTRAIDPDRVAAKAARVAELETLCRGWNISLGNPNLPPRMREDLTDAYEAAQQEIETLDNQILSIKGREEAVKKLTDPDAVVGRLHRLSQVMASYNAAAINLELAKHIVEIRCSRDGTVVLKGTHLGLFDGVEAMLSRSEDACAGTDADDAARFPKVRPRRRARRYKPNLSSDAAASAKDLYRLLDPARFEGLPDAFVWEETFCIEPEPCWAEAHADEVYAAWLEEQNLSRLPPRFGVSLPTIRKARNIGRDRAAARGSAPAAEAAVPPTSEEASS